MTHLIARMHAKAILAALFIGAGLGLSASINNIDIFILWFFVPLIWLAFPNRWIATLFTFSFYLSVSWEIVPGLLNYVNWDWIIFLEALVAWCAAAVIPCIPWLICLPKNRDYRILVSLFFLFLLLTLPPFGVLIWANPLTCAGLIYPGLSWLGFIACFLLICSTALAIYVPTYRRIALIATVILLGLAGFAHIHFSSTKKVPNTWVALNTSSRFVTYDSYLIELVKEQLKVGKKVIILPENTVNIDKLTDKISWQALIHLLQIHHATLVSGGYQIDSHSLTTYDGFYKKHREGVLIINQNNIRFHDTRQPLPIMSWLPFGWGKLQANWFQTGVYEVQNKKVGVFVCFEGHVIWIAFMTLLAHPDILVCIANEYWNLPTAIHKLEFLFQIWGRLLNTPVLMAENL